MGFSRRKTVLSAYGVTLIFMVLGLIAYWSKNQLTPVMLGVFTLILILCAGGLRFSREWFAVGRVVGNSLAMRQDVQSALCLTRWLSMEARRKTSAECLWLDLIFVAERLGFTSVKLTMNGAVKIWQGTQAGPTPGRSRQMSLGPQGNLLELGADQETTNDPAPPARLSAHDQAKLRARFADPRAFSIISDVLAEAWLQSVKNWEKQHGVPLKFIQNIPAVNPPPDNNEFTPLILASLKTGGSPNNA